MDLCSYEQVDLTNFKNEMNNSEEEDSLIQTVEDENNSNYVNNCSCIHIYNRTHYGEAELENILETEKTKLFKEKRPTKKIKQNEELVSVFNRSCDEKQNILNTIYKDEKDEDPTDAFFKTMAFFQYDGSAVHIIFDEKKARNIKAYNVVFQESGENV